jgi:hypothetical protein
MGGVFTKIGNFFRSCWNGAKTFFKTALELVIHGISKLVILIYEKNVLTIQTTGIGRDLYAWAKGVKEELEKNDINPKVDLDNIIEDMKYSNKKKQLVFRLDSFDIKEPIHSEEENEALKEINNKYNLDLDFKSENITISHYKSFDDEQLSKLLSINFENIKNLELSYNSITTINPLKRFDNCSPLQILDLSNNEITQIDEFSLCKFCFLEELDISNNKIEYIDSLNHFEQLKKVNISSNNIKPDQKRIINILKEKKVEVIQ